jgi:hypothetical protein
MRRPNGVASLTRILGASLVAWGIACRGDTMGPQGPLAVQLLPARDSVVRGAPGQPLAQPVKFRALDAATAQPIAGAEVVWTVTGTGGHLDHPVAVTGSDGGFTAQWVLGTRASETQRLRADVSLSGRTAFAQVRAVAIPVQVAALKLVTDTTPVLAGTARQMQAYATDPYGNRFVPQGLRYASLDTTIVTVDSLGTLRGSVSGIGRVQVAVSSLADTGVVRVIQILQAIKVDHDTLHFWALRQLDTLKVTLIDTQGLPIPGLLPTVTLQDTSLASVRVGRPVTVTSAKNGTTTLLLSGGGVTTAVVVQVQQIPALMQAAPAYPTAILASAVGSVVPLRCQVWDVKGNLIALDPTVTGSATGVVAGTHCSDLHVQRSGLDTVRLAAGSTVTTVPVVVAVPAVVTGSPLGDFIDVSSFPGGEPWAPSARINSHGQLEVYVAWGITDTVTGLTHEDLRRLVSSDDGVTFANDGVALQHDSTACSLTGYGFENMYIVPRAEAPGWRMFVAGGQFSCYGWQVFSAVSTDEKTWTLEPGVRANAGAPPSSNGAAPDPYWPTGEGITVDQLASGGWRMLMGAYEHLTPAEEKFQIMEWDSPDQINWTYGHTVLSTREMPAAGAGTIYSPTITQVAPGLWRMIFAGDDRTGTQMIAPRSWLWSAVSTDKETWQLEGKLMGSDGTSLMYANLAGDRLVFIRQDDTTSSARLAIATVTMP